MEQKLDVYFRNWSRGSFLSSWHKGWRAPWSINPEPIWPWQVPPDSWGQIPVMRIGCKAYSRLRRVFPGPLVTWLHIDSYRMLEGTLPLAFMSVQYHSQPLQLLLFFVSSIFLSACVPCFCCLFLSFPLIVWVATQALRSKYLVHENYICGLSRVQCPYLQTVHTILGSNSDGEATAVKTRHSTQVSCQQLVPFIFTSFVLCVLSLPRTSSCFWLSKFLYFYYVFSMSIFSYSWTTVSDSYLLITFAVTKYLFLIAVHRRPTVLSPSPLSTKALLESTLRHLVRYLVTSSDTLLFWVEHVSVHPNDVRVMSFVTWHKVALELEQWLKG